MRAPGSRPEVGELGEGSGRGRTYFLEGYTKEELVQFPVYIVSKRRYYRAIAVTHATHVSADSIVRVVDGDVLQIERFWVDFDPVDDLVERYSQRRWTTKEREDAEDEWFAIRYRRDAVLKEIDSLWGSLKQAKTDSADLWSLQFSELGLGSKKQRETADDRVMSIRNRHTKKVADNQKEIESLKKKLEAAKNYKKALGRQLKQDLSEIEASRKSNVEILTKRLQAKFDTKRSKLPQRSAVKARVAELQEEYRQLKLAEYKASEQIVLTHGPGTYEFGVDEDRAFYSPGVYGGHVMLKRVDRKLGTL